VLHDVGDSLRSTALHCIVLSLLLCFDGSMIQRLLKKILHRRLGRWNGAILFIFACCYDTMGWFGQHLLLVEIRVTCTRFFHAFMALAFRDTLVLINCMFLLCYYT